MSQIEDLLKYLDCQAAVYQASRKLYMPPAERAEKIKFYTESAAAVRRLVSNVQTLGHDLDDAMEIAREKRHAQAQTHDP